MQEETRPVINTLDSEDTAYKKWLVFLGVPEGWMWPKYIVNQTEEPENWRDIEYLSIHYLLLHTPSPSELFLGLFENQPDKESNARTFLRFLFQIKKTMTFEEIREFYKEVEIDNPYTNFQSFTSGQDGWMETLAREIGKMKEKINRLSTIQDYLLSLEPVAYSSFEVISSDLQLEIRHKGERLNKVSGLNFFDSSQPSENVPLLRYEDDINVVYKIYHQPEYLRRVQNKAFNMILSPEKIPFYIRFILWAETKKYTQKSFIEGYVDIENSSIVVFSIPIDRVSQEMVIEKIKSAFDVEVVNSEQSSISGRFDIYGPLQDGQLTNFTLNEYVLADMITNYEFFYTFLHLEESTDSIGEKEKFGIVFSNAVEDASERPSLNITNPSFAAASFLTQENQQGTIARLADGRSIRIEGENKYIITRISKGKSMEDIRRSIDIFARLLKMYLMFLPSVDIVYRHFISQSGEHKASIKDRQPRKTEGKKLSLLYEALPGYLKHGYGRICQTLARQPEVITNLEEWLATPIVVNGVPMQRSYLQYPAGGSVLLGCTDPKYPYLKLKESDTGNPDVPYVPCCGETPVQNTYLFRKYYMGEDVKRRPRRLSNVIATLRSLDANRLGNVNPVLDQLYNLFHPTNAKKFFRMGVLKSPYSMIHCLLYAISPEYAGDENDENRAAMAFEYRQKLKEINSAVYKQELYDYSMEEIAEQVNNDKTVLEASMYYRGLEELFDVNIFIFSHDKDQNLVLEIPRHEHFHIRYKNERQTVLLYHFPNEQYELIGFSVEEDGRHMDLDALLNDINDLMFSLLSSLHVVYNFDVFPPFAVKTDKADEQRSLFHTKNLFSMYDIKNFLSSVDITGQFIDGSGKGRGYEYMFGSSKGAILTFPLQPDNLPLVEYGTYTLTFDEALKLFGDPYSADYQDDKIIGLWYSYLGIPEAFYIPVVSIVVTTEFIRGPQNPLLSSGENTIKRFKNLKILYSVIEQILIWSFKLMRKTLGITSYNFMVNFTTILEVPGDSLSQYKLESPLRVSNFFPSSEKEIFDYAAKRVKGLVKDNKFVLYSNKMRLAMWHKLKRIEETQATMMIEQFDKKSIPALDIVPEKMSVHLQVQDFSKKNYTLIVLGDENYRQWKLSQTDTFSTKFKDFIDINNIYQETPYLYFDKSGRAYIVQNVATTDKYRALAVCYNWYTTRINTGYHTKSYKDVDEAVYTFPYIVYGVKTDLSLTILEDHTMGKRPYLELLSYGSNIFSALLPIV